MQQFIQVFIELNKNLNFDFGSFKELYWRKRGFDTFLFYSEFTRFEKPYFKSRVLINYFKKKKKKNLIFY